MTLRTTLVTRSGSCSHGILRTSRNRPVPRGDALLSLVVSSTSRRRPRSAQAAPLGAKLVVDGEEAPAAPRAPQRPVATLTHSPSGPPVHVVCVCVHVRLCVCACGVTCIAHSEMEPAAGSLELEAAAGSQCCNIAALLFDIVL